MFFGQMDVNNCYLDIQVGLGGIEVQDWVDMLLWMYLCWGECFGFKIDLIEVLDGDVVGIKSVMIQFQGEYVYGWLKIEIGVYWLV